MQGFKNSQLAGLIIVLGIVFTGLTANAQRFYEGNTQEPVYEDAILESAGWNDGYGGYPPGDYGYQQPGYGGYQPDYGYQQPGYGGYPPSRRFPRGGPRSPGYGYGRGGYGGPCQDAQQELRLAQTGLTIAIDNLNNIGDRCNSNPLCIVGYQNVYNTAVSNVQKAQQKIQRACRR